MSKKEIVFDILVQLSFRPPFLLHRDRYGEYREQAANNAGRSRSMPLDSQSATQVAIPKVANFISGIDWKEPAYRAAPDQRFSGTAVGIKAR